MVWKPKEKALTQEEAVELARQELAPHWVGCSPVLAGVRLPDGRLTVLPLDPEFAKRSWLIFMLDPTLLTGDTLLHYAREWERRFAAQNLHFLLFMNPIFEFLKNHDAIKPLLKKHDIKFPYLIDPDGLLFEALAQLSHKSGAKDFLPRVLLIHNKSILFSHGPGEWNLRSESAVHEFLRSFDPGLPLAPKFDAGGGYPFTSECLYFGKKHGPAQFDSKTIIFKGKWERELERIYTSDPQASIEFTSPCSRVSIVAQAVNLENSQAPVLAGENTWMGIALEGEPVFEAAAGEDLRMEDDGTSGLRLERPRIYRALTQLSAATRRVTLRFPIANRMGAAIYSVQFSD